MEKVHVVCRPNKLVWDGTAPDFDKPGRPPDIWAIAPEPEDPEREALAAERKEEYS